nr:MAG TPA: hypothetical protein [Caudoviricetes sp.]
MHIEHTFLNFFVIFSSFFRHKKRSMLTLSHSPCLANGINCERNSSVVDD